MNRSSSVKAVGASLGIAAILAAGCGGQSDGGDGSQSSPSATTVAGSSQGETTSITGQTDSQYPEVPTPEELNSALARGLDPAVPVEEKASLIQGAEQDPELINQVAAAAVANNAVIEIISIDDLGDGTLSAGTTLTINGQTNPGAFTFVAEDGVWKLSKDNACTLVQLAQLTSPACG